MTLKPRIEMVLLLAIAASTQGLQVADVVGATMS
jgi:hypothetical protein